MESISHVDFAKFWDFETYVFGAQFFFTPTTSADIDRETSISQVDFGGFWDFEKMGKRVIYYD